MTLSRRAISVVYMETVLAWPQQASVLPTEMGMPLGQSRANCPALEFSKGPGLHITPTFTFTCSDRLSAPQIDVSFFFSPRPFA
jgi:hypothetical protein